MALSCPEQWRKEVNLWDSWKTAGGRLHFLGCSALAWRRARHRRHAPRHQRTALGVIPNPRRQSAMSVPASFYDELTKAGWKVVIKGLSGSASFSGDPRSG